MSPGAERKIPERIPPSGFDDEIDEPFAQINVQFVRRQRCGARVGRDLRVKPSHGGEQFVMESREPSLGFNTVWTRDSHE